MTDTILSQLSEMESHLEVLKKLSGRVAATDDVPHPDHVVTNTQLLVGALRKFYRTSRSASYFPSTASGALSRILSNVLTNFAKPALVSDDKTLFQESATGLLIELDKLYAAALQYGLISFGFKGKQVQGTVLELQNCIGTLEKQEKERDDELDAIISEAEDHAKTESARITSFRAEAEASLAALKSAVDQAITGSKESLKKIEASEASSLEIEDALKELKSTSIAAAESAEQSNTEIEELIDSVRKASAAATLERGQALSSLQKDLADAAARVKSIQESKSAIEVELESITDFYGDIEKHQQDMLDVKKEIAASVSAFKTETGDAFTGFQSRTNEIVVYNEKLQSEIRDHLRKAVGISLFTAFDTRRRQIGKTSILWASVLGTFVFFAVVFAFWFVHALTTVKAAEPYILARLIVAAPITFMIGFAASQYTKERRAEEEYAFKSTISVSLDSFRELIDRIKREGSEADTDFVRKLVLEVFDNPGKRLYPDKESKAEGADKSLLGTLDTLNKLAKTLQDVSQKLPGH